MYETRIKQPALAAAQPGPSPLASLGRPRAKSAPPSYRREDHVEPGVRRVRSASNSASLHDAIAVSKSATTGHYRGHTYTEAFIKACDSVPYDGERSPRTHLLRMLRHYKGDTLPDKACESVYFWLWSTAGARGHDAVNADYGDVMRVLEEHWPSWTHKPCIQRFEYLVTEDSLVGAVYRHRTITPFDPKRHEVLVFGATPTTRRRFSKVDELSKLYGVNITPPEDTMRAYKIPFHETGADLIADMNSAAELRSIPDGALREVCTEHIPAYNYYNPQFFANVRRILAPGGCLVINKMEYMQQSPWNITNCLDYFCQHGFEEDIAAQPRTRACIRGDAWILRATLSEPASKGVFSRSLIRITLAILRLWGLEP